MGGVNYITLLLTALIAYLIGSFPTGYLAVKFKTGEDIRNSGSGSTGATNVRRSLGKRWGLFVMAVDFIKGALPVFLARLLLDDNLGIYAAVAGLFVILGHSKPIFLNFKGGKSVASGVGALAALSPIVAFLVAFIWACVTAVTKYVSVGSIVAIIFAPIYAFFYDVAIGYKIFCIIAAIYIIFLHIPNIKRLLKGEEDKMAK